MSRSRRKTPICGIAVADSDKDYKAAEHRRERRAVRIAIEAGDDIPAAKAYGNPWDSPKDGKKFFDAENHPSIMRK